MAANPIDPDGMRRDRHEHGGASDRLDDDALARRTVRERVDAGLEDYDPDDVPPATDVAPTPDLADSADYQEETAEIRREIAEGELYPLTDKHPFPPSHYDKS
jgi:hypothetical protein